jgi:hypothetical protein
MSVRIEATELRVCDGAVQVPFPAALGEPCGALHPTDCIHGRLVFEIDGRLVDQPGAGGADDTCLRDWVALLTWSVGQLEDDAHIERSRHGLEEQPVFFVRGSRVFIVDRGSGKQIGCDLEELRSAIATFLETLRSRIVAAHPDGERWWSDVCERAVRSPSLFPGR